MMEMDEEGKHRTSTMDSSIPRFNDLRQEERPLSPQKTSRSAANVSFNPASYTYSPVEDMNSATAPEGSPGSVHNRPQSPVVVVNRSVRDEPMVVTKVDPGAADNYAGGVVQEGSGGGRGVVQKPRPTVLGLGRSKRESIVNRLALGLRLCGFIFCLVSFAVMAANKYKGWSLDSFDRYTEFRYCMSLNVIGFVYSGCQAIDLVYHLSTGKYVLQRDKLRCFFDFFSDQMTLCQHIAYISMARSLEQIPVSVIYNIVVESEINATRVDDWISNWGKDQFPTMATASVAISFLAFLSFAFSSFISGYTLCMFNYA